MGHGTIYVVGCSKRIGKLGTKPDTVAITQVQLHGPLSMDFGYGGHNTARIITKTNRPPQPCPN